jgi:predicted nucleic acid-binding protein
LSFLVDTNVICEPKRKRPEGRVLDWLRDNEQDLYLSSITLGEIRRGIERLPNGKKRNSLQAWMTKLNQIMEGRILNFNVSVAHVWGQQRAKWEKSGISVSDIDSQLAATALRHQLTLVTRNTAYFDKCGLALLNPFEFH